MVGILVAQSGTTYAPSVHYAAALSGISLAFRDLVERFINGHIVEPDGDTFDILPIKEGPEYSQVVCVDLSPGVDRCFLIDLWPRRDNGRLGSWDDRGSPRLLEDVRIDGQWQLYNCVITLRTRSLSSVFPDGEFPAD